MREHQETGAYALADRPLVMLAEVPPVDIRAMLGYLLGYKWWIVGVALLFGAAGAAYSLLASPWYRSEVVLVAAERGSQLSGLGQLGGLASLAGIDIGSDGSSEHLAVLRSSEFSREFIERRKLLTVLFADRWDEQAGAWRERDPEDQPEIREAVDYFEDKVRHISEDSRSGTITIQVLWKDPVLAADWANGMATSINEKLRSRALQEAEQNVKYLQGELAATSINSLQQSIGRVLESELQKLMMARGSEEYAFKVVDRATPARKRYRPQRALIVLMSLLAGGIAAVGFLLLRRSLAGVESAKVFK